ncbi:MAG: hypothetical protein ACXAEL_04835 [Candidatus Hodarchaeales archaeon]
MSTTILAELVRELSTKSGLNKTEIRRLIMALQKTHPSHPTIEKATFMVAEVFGISRASTIENQQSLDTFFKPIDFPLQSRKLSADRNGKERQNKTIASVEKSTARNKASETLVGIAEEEIQRLWQLIPFLERKNDWALQILSSPSSIFQIICPQCGKKLSARINLLSKNGTDGLRRISIPHDNHVLTALVDNNLNIRRFQISDAIEPLSAPIAKMGS